MLLAEEDSICIDCDVHAAAKACTASASSLATEAVATKSRNSVGRRILFGGSFRRSIEANRREARGLSLEEKSTVEESNNELVDALGSKAADLRDISLDVCEEIKTSNGMLDRLSAKFDVAQVSVQKTTSQIRSLPIWSCSRSFWQIFAFTLLLLVLLYVLGASRASTSSFLPKQTQHDLSYSHHVGTADTAMPGISASSGLLTSDNSFLDAGAGRSAAVAASKHSSVKNLREV
eukprot:TRINITY_DN4204_c0_g1_i1.p1 TRINITY_DN4204_c0_g1~~TRINITY_DN4204_c0_g1_i1.p1  ORF type:complete len:249 (+),score=37.65 TRINITY_DN4204_c0_g1_i1:48-749(+)